MSKKSNSTSVHRDERTSHREVAQQLGGAPDKIRKKWSAQILRRGSLTGPAFLEFKFPTQGGGLSELTVRNSDLRHNKLLDQFSDYLPIFPANVRKTDTAQYEFIRGLVSSAASSITLLPDTTGFIDIGMFVTYSEMIYADGRRGAPAAERNRDACGRRHQGNPERCKKKLLKLARHSTSLAFGIGVGLAAPLPTYVKLCRKQDESIPETCS